MTIGRFKYKTYTGTMESLEELVRDLNWEFGAYYIDALSPVKELVNAKLGIIYQIGDVYVYWLPDEFEAVG
jgi:hypothetical protein